jgi:glycosyltransferase involved in cell wall biosynthesis
MINNLIEVHVPLRNEVSSLEALIDAFERQTFKDFVVIFHDNASDDGSTELLRKLTHRDSKYQHIIYKYRRHVLLQAMRIVGFPFGSDFVSMRSANDLILPNYYGEIFEILNTDTSVALAYSHGFEVAEASTVGTLNRLHEITTLGLDRFDALRHVVSTYTSPFSLWGTYRVSAFEKLNHFIHSYGADHVRIAQISLLGVIRPTKDPLDIRINRKTKIKEEEERANLTPVWVTHHPELLAGMRYDSSYASPDLNAPFCSMLIGHLEMLRHECRDDIELELMSRIVVEELGHRFGYFIKNELAMLKTHGSIKLNSGFQEPDSPTFSSVASLIPASRSELLLAIGRLFDAE